MADNYLEKRYEEVFGSRGGAPKGVTLQHPSLEKLLARNRSYRAYDKSYVVHRLQLEAIVAVNQKVASSVNMQVLRFRTLTRGPLVGEVLSHIRMGRALPSLHLPLPGTEPEAFIVVCSKVGETPSALIDLGISLQSMLLKAVDLGLGGLIVRNFDKEALRASLDLPYEPVAVLAIGKPAENVVLEPAREGDSLSYWRTEDGVHHVPKLSLEDILV